MGACRPWFRHHESLPPPLSPGVTLTTGASPPTPAVQGGSEVLGLCGQISSPNFCRLFPVMVWCSECHERFPRLQRSSQSMGGKALSVQAKSNLLMSDKATYRYTKRNQQQKKATNLYLPPTLYWAPPWLSLCQTSISVPKCGLTFPNWVSYALKGLFLCCKTDNPFLSKPLRARHLIGQDCLSNFLHISACQQEGMAGVHPRKTQSRRHERWACICCGGKNHHALKSVLCFWFSTFDVSPSECLPWQKCFHCRVKLPLTSSFASFTFWRGVKVFCDKNVLLNEHANPYPGLLGAQWPQKFSRKFRFLAFLCWEAVSPGI